MFRGRIQIGTPERELDDSLSDIRQPYTHALQQLARESLTVSLSQTDHSNFHAKACFARKLLNKKYQYTLNSEVIKGGGLKLVIYTYVFLYILGFYSFVGGVSWVQGSKKESE